MTTRPDSTPELPSAGDYLIASKTCELKSLQYFLQMGRLVQCISNLVHGLQRERGASNVFLGSAGRKFAGERQDLIAESDRLKTEFGQALAEIHRDLTEHPVSSQLLNQIACALYSLDGLAELRQAVSARTITAVAAMEEYSRLVHNLIAVVFEAADTAVDPTIAGVLVAMVHLMNGKELCGQERAAGSAGFSAGHFDAALSRRMVHLFEAQERCFEVFTDFADPDSMSLWQELLAHDRELEIARLRRLASSVGPSVSKEPALAEKWFMLMTERIDGLKKVEESVEGCFHSRCVERFADARNSLAHQEALIASLDARKMTQPPVLVVCESATEANAASAADTENPANPASPAAGAFSASAISQHFGRSVLDLVQEQTRRLQQMSSELQSAREALEDRKVQEKAVLLLMKHRRINNDEAHRALRKLAMDQGKKLPETARALLAMASALK